MATTVQLLLNQLFSILVFYFLSRSLTKSDFGELNWTLAIFLAAFGMLSFGLDQVVVKKIAAGEERSSLLSLYFFHVVFTGGIFYAFLLLSNFLFPSFHQSHALLLMIGAGKLLLTFAGPFKSVAAGQEHFRAVLYMSVSSTIIKALGLCYLFYQQEISLATIVPVFVLADASEFLLGFYILQKQLKTPLLYRFKRKAYFQFVKESLPQVGVVVFSTALARIDWILIGLFLSAAKLAEYSFAYKAFEISTLPLLAIAPLLVPYFTRMMRDNNRVNSHSKLQLLFRVEMMVVCLFALCLNTLWNPLIDNVTNEKYGTVNTTTIFILSLSLPVLYLNNFLWSLHFAGGRLRLILYSFVLCFGVNLLGNFLLIPLYQNNGAAFSYLLSISAQTIYYAYRLQHKTIINWQAFFFCTACALCSGFITRYTTFSFWWIVPGSILIYLFLLLITVQLRRSDWPAFRQVLVR